jgi:CDP-diacylglycerol--glycerol-3-phosphate 3-phosphatidyltransferase
MCGRTVEGKHQGSLSVNNQELIERFESDMVPESSFHHADHVRLAFAYLCEYPALQALEKFAVALKHYATARDKSQLYNETVTHAYFFLIRDRMARSTWEDWDEFARGNADLFTWKNGILSRYYHEATLRSDLAQSVFLFPDKFA